MEWYSFIGLGIAVLAAIFGVTFWAKWKQLVKFFIELGEAANKTADILEDQKVTKQEALNGLKEWMDVWYAGLALLPTSLVKKIWERFTY